ncbi:hypothetical protein [Mycolicibacterium mageritense]|uniref:hypothetical protein n=1 Tax=Mycolicibacterium mageritense TaxID=53462 RepID=UPI0011D5BE42|nr:hypothetical protein [Mycolicibacterium mageritense]TXI55761.1 MAG: hypothetical protein E6Q55_30595 [Mycolicibacterium mageritense]
MATQLPPAPAPPVGAPPAAAPDWSGQPRYPLPPQPPVQGPRRRGPLGPWILAAIALVAAIGALVLGVIAVGKPPQVQSAPATSAAPEPSPAAPILFDDAADRALCEALPDLMRERNEADRAYQALPAGSPERSAAMPAYKEGVQDWAQRTQDVLAAHATPDRYLTRTLQRFIDDQLLYAQNIYPNRPSDRFDEDTWNTGVVSYGGALGRCNQLGIRWQ